jgi:superfamily II DNA or RNA helicase
MFTAVQILALKGEIRRFTPRARTRGQQYVDTGRVGPLAFDGQCVRATVRGTELYHTLWEWTADGWEPDCSCPVAPYCKHAYALGCRIVGDGAVGAERAVARPPAARRVLPRVPASVPGSAVLERLRSARERWARERYFTQLVEKAIAAGFNFYLSPFPEILEEPDPDLLCWRLAQAIPQRANGWLPPALESYRERPDLAERHAQRARLSLATELVQWAEQQRKLPQRSLRLVMTLVPLRDQVGVSIEARLTTPRAADAPRTMPQLQQLRNEVRRMPGALPPDQAALLEWLTDAQVGGNDAYYTGYGPTRRLTGTVLKPLLARVAGSPLASWALDVAPDLAARGGIVPGAPVRLHADPVRLLPACVAREGAVWVEFSFLWPGGRQRRLDDVLYLRGTDDWSARTHPSFIIADGEFALVIEEPPETLLERFRDAGGLPLAPTDRGQVLGLLAAHFPHLRETLAARTRYHAVRPVITLDLRDDDWMQIRLFAHSGNDPWRPGVAVSADVAVFEYAPEARWVRYAALAAEQASADAQVYERIAAQPASAEHAPQDGDAAPTDDAELWLEEPDPQLVTPAMEWLSATEAVPGVKKGFGGREPTWPDRAVGWWLRASRRRMEEFADAWERVPDGVATFGTDRIRRLLSGELRVTPLLHIESSGMDWFSVSAAWEAEGLQLTDDDLSQLRAATTRFVKLSSGWTRRDAVALHDEAAAVLADLGVEAGNGAQRVTLWQLATAQPASLAALERFGADAATLDAVRQLRQRVAGFSGLPHVPPPPGLSAELRPYQQLGLDFLTYTAGSLGIGAVLADDMGLGKTIQALAWLVHLQREDPAGGPSLVVCPASVVHNWEREAARFASGLRVLLLTSGKTRHELRREIPAHDLIVTNYALLRRDIEAWRAVELRAAILDEAQNIKNPDAVVTRAALTLRARYRLALTGTPLENRALDLWSIMQFVNPGYLGIRSQFESRYDRLDAPPHVRTLLAAKLRPVLLRRTKLEVAPELPERIEERLDCEMTKEQRQLYLAELRRSRALVDRLSGAPGGITQNKIHILAALIRLRQICCHPALAGGKVSLGSGKFDALFELLEPLLAEGHKVLLFSQFVECLKLLKAEFKVRGIAFHLLTGQTVKRQQVVDAFQGDPQASVFLISLKAGGTGLNLTAASYVVLFDPWWNPAVEAQAIDRTHRIGQDRTVIAYRMLTSGTIEEKIWELQQRKAALARDILGEGGFARALTRDDLDYLLAEV